MKSIDGLTFCTTSNEGIRFMAIDLSFLLVLTILILPIKCHSGFDTVLDSDNGHLHESAAYKYSQQANMNDLTLINNNIFLSILSINLIPIIFIYFLIPITILRRYKFFLTILLSFAIGGLMADVFLRILPLINLSYNNNQTQSPDHHQHDTRPGSFILLGIFFSFILEKFFRYFQNPDDQTESINVLSYIFLLGNLLHTYTNSLSLTSIFPIKSVTIIPKVTYEILHILYAYAILIYSGFSSTKVLRYQLLTGLTGTIISFIVLQFQSNLTAQLWSNQIVLPIIAGIFVYISTVHIIPEVMTSNYGTVGTISKVTACIISGFVIFCLNKYE